jgi:hypothetical protein
VDEITDIGLDLVSRLEASIGDRVYKAIVLRIRTKVLDARNDPDTAGRRWPFELIQNAHDAGGRAESDGITLFFRNAEASDIPIRNTTTLRYAVPPELWEEGLDLDDWVDTAFPSSSV